MQELAEENARLEFEKKSSFNESASLEEELQKAKLNASPGIEQLLWCDKSTVTRWGLLGKFRLLGLFQFADATSTIC